MEICYPNRAPKKPQYKGFFLLVGVLPLTFVKLLTSLARFDSIAITA